MSSSNVVCFVSSGQPIRRVFFTCLVSEVVGIDPRVTARLNFISVLRYHGALSTLFVVMTPPPQFLGDWIN